MAEPRNTQWGDGVPAWLVAAPIVLLVLAIVAYLYGIPLLARAAADRIPTTLAQRLESATLAALDREVFAQSAVPRDRQAAITAALRALKRPAGSSESVTLVFRKSDAIGANAMALPAGTIVVTDGLIALARDDREILGVLAHEAGHIDGRHSLRGILQDSLIGMLLAITLGDVSALAAAASSTLLEASYSRSLEREADAYAIEMLKANGIPLKHLADMLRRLESAAGTSGLPSALKYLSTHPATEERIRQLSL